MIYFFWYNTLFVTAFNCFLFSRKKICALRLNYDLNITNSSGIRTCVVARLEKRFDKKKKKTKITTLLGVINTTKAERG
ncbi:hypothetical protein ASPWEDRAFT_418147 [Aspergillus wentii DTO 134E9]|uniref:Uncharacterized protein n=1 Tax=Aspergillus wentii DTO 134E9 TaxID=1073089 RepID=A0A1L9RP95_ASPWE|nr:uncharacterized protein ASPWEDRAFT_418147 [Aspergillus wentii DTO 134E9]OJJ36693.1 hypothetical protein ASPWEDRAFT_418147 [Aspergillus wentii DTO 134E9]